ncbi:arabinofuranosyltransferase [Amycolatopsis sp. WQ 127309]|uniref:arabinofuranosyltransferase n=1 Tax=Amycolatopsis sp. WQ 127309 TaxID=2932773 RepID=UPI001FF50870|nr:arabinofuranosyltransferase [Amycolatopsis sp. WQ 127309]UOZ11193.1 arabinofuranosyltransferase [Amycolatopsis sp. WQ 127309]
MKTVVVEEPAAVSPWRLVNRVTLGLTVAGFAAAAWDRRWMSDDGLIVLRTVRQLLAGNGPVFNVGERVEANTSTLWTYLLAAFGWVPGVPLEWVAVVTGLLCSAAGLLLALDGARRLGGGFTLPAGGLVVLALPPFRDFATSGLETGLILLWLGGTWWLLVRSARRQPSGPLWTTAVAVGLGVLVRPDLLLFSVFAGIGLLVLEWRGWRAAAAWLAAAAALPLAYQVFRMGYYGLLTPNTALVKEASRVRCDQGFAYLDDFFTPYLLWIPLALCAVAALLRRFSFDRRVVVVCAVPVVAGLGLALYVVRMGGDFMHARMLLPALFCLLLPVMTVRLTRASALPVAALGAYALIAAGDLRTAYADLPAPLDEATGIADERASYVVASGHANPVLATDFTRFTAIADRIRPQLAAEPAPVVFWDDDSWHAYPTAAGHSTGTFFNIGGPGLLLPLDVAVHDPIGLANPLAAHTTPYPGRRVGHDKYAGPIWTVADQGVGAPAGFPPDRLAAIRRTLACPEVREMLDSVRAPWTFERFRDNLLGAFARTSLRYDHDPVKAQYCGPA